MTSAEIVYSHCLPTPHIYCPPTYGKMEVRTSANHQWGSLPFPPHHEPDKIIWAPHCNIMVSSSTILLFISHTSVRLCTHMPK